MSRPPNFRTKFGQSNPDKAELIRRTVQNDVDYSQQGQGRPFCFITFFTFTTILPPLHLLVDEFRGFIFDAIVDRDMKDDLEMSKVINWCRTAKPLFPLRTTADGNCLLHAVSLAVWGLEDDNQFLRRLLYVSLVNDERQSFQKRWKLQQSSINANLPGFDVRFNTNEWTEEWENVIKAASDVTIGQQTSALPFSTLEAIHLYVLANLLRRPIITLSYTNARTVYGHSIQENNLRGIYLPLEWSAAECYKSPLVIGFSMNHFAPLISYEDGPDSPQTNFMSVVPIVTSAMEPLIIHFLLPDEEHKGPDLLKGYLKIQEITQTVSDGVNVVLSAKLEKNVAPGNLNLMNDYREDCERKYSHWLNSQYGCMENHVTPAERQAHLPGTETSVSFVAQETNAGNSTSIGAALNIAGELGPDDSLLRENANPFSLQTECVSHGCKMFGSPATANMCSKCFNDYTVQYRREEEAKRQRERAEPTAPPPSFQPEPSFVDLSIMGENCHNNCGLRCSTETYPYCHECHQKMVPKPPQASAVVIGQPGQKCSSVTCTKPAHFGLNGLCESCYERNLFGTAGVSPSQSTIPGPVAQPHTVLNQLNSSKCSTPHCGERSSLGSNNKCVRCYVQNITPPPQQLGAPTDPTRPLDSRHSSETQMLNIIPQTTPGATGGNASPESPGTPVLSSSGSSLVQKNLCVTPGCDGVRLVDRRYNGMCLTCVGPSQPSKPAMTNPRSEGGRILSMASSISVQESMTPVSIEKINPIITSSKQKVKCAGPICNTLIYPPKKLCDTCASILEKSHAQMSREHGGGALAVAQAQVGGRKPCKKLGCEFYGSEGRQGFCSNCYKESKKGQASHSAPIRSIPPLSFERSSTAPQNAVKGRKCIIHGCDKYGDPATSERCVEHYKQTQVFLPTTRTMSAAPVSSGAGIDPYLAAMRKVEISRKSSSTCRTEGCPNYGNSACDGYCNPCYVQVLHDREGRRRQMIGEDQCG